MKTTTTLFLALVLSFFSLLASAGPGHDHGETAPATSGQPLPRFAAVSEDLELVGIVNGKQLTLYLDRFSDNSSVNGADISIGIAGSTYTAEKHGDGEYTLNLNDTLKPGTVAITATIKAGELTDLLVAELDVQAHKEAPNSGFSWRAAALWIGAGLLVLAVLGVIFRMRQQARRALALVTTLILVGLGTPSSAGEGHDHGATPAAANASGPQRMADGTVFLPKPAQRQLNVRTLVVKSAELPRTFELNGRVLMDPNAGGKVQAIHAGRIEPSPSGLPNPGQAVKKGQVLAYVRAALAPLEVASQSAQLAEIRAAKALTEKRLARLSELSDTVPRKEVEAAQSELVSLTDRMAALSDGLVSKEALLAPISGVIAAAHVVAGQVVDARELIFEIVDAKRLRIEALAFDSTLAHNLSTASLAVGEKRVSLRFLGAARSLREQALPLNFQAQSPELLGLALGQPVKVYVQSKQKVSGIAVAQSALMKNAANQDVIWVKRAAEQFEPRTVTFEALDGARVMVTSGLNSGDRVVTQGVTLINQIR